MKTDINNKEMIPSKAKIIIISTVIILIAFAHTLGLIQYLRKSSIRSEIIHYLKTCDSNSLVTVNNVAVTNSASIITELKKIHEGIGNHSHPLEPFEIYIRNGTNTLKLVLARDSRDPKGYWVKTPDIGPSYYDSIGGLKTDMFDKIK